MPVRAVTKRLPKLWPFSPPPPCEAVLKELGEQGLVFGEGHHAVADVARREHVELAAQAAGTAAVVCHGDNGGNFNLTGLAGVGFQAMQEGGQACPASDRHDS